MPGQLLTKLKQPSRYKQKPETAFTEMLCILGSKLRLRNLDSHACAGNAADLPF